MGLRNIVMKLMVKVSDAVALARRFREAPGLTMQEVVGQVRNGMAETLERVMAAELRASPCGEPGPGQQAEWLPDSRPSPSRDSARSRCGFPATAKAPSRAASFLRRYATTRPLSATWRRFTWPASRRACSRSSAASCGVEGVRPGRFRIRSTAFCRQRGSSWSGALRSAMICSSMAPTSRVRGTTVAKEPTLVVLEGVDEGRPQSVLSLVFGDRDSRSAWDMVFSSLKERGLDGTAVRPRHHGRASWLLASAPEQR